MDVRFEDHAQLHRAAAQGAAGAAAAALIAPGAVMVQAAIAGGAFAVAGWPGAAPEGRRRRMAAAVAVCLAAGASAFEPGNSWLLAAAGALLGLVVAAARADAAKESGARTPSAWTLLLAAGLCGGAVVGAGVTLPWLAEALAGVVPRFLVAAACGAATMLWAVLATAPLHVAFGGDLVETRLGALRATLGADLRSLAERAALARREAIASLPEGARGDLRTLLDSLAMASLDVAERASSLGRAAPPGSEEELTRRVAQLEASAAASADGHAAKSYTRAAEALSGQLDHLRRVRRARERAVARLHEEVAHLERAKFALALLQGADAERSALELDLLHGRLEVAAAPFEPDDASVEPPAVESAAAQRATAEPAPPIREAAISR